MKAEEVEKNLRRNPNKYVLKANQKGKAEVWKSFRLIYENAATEDADTPVAGNELKYFCACVVCRKVYAYKAPDGSSYGTKNLLDHISQCSAASRPAAQMQLEQCLKHHVNFTQKDCVLIKRQQVEFCVNGYHSFRSVEHPGFVNLLQTCVDMGAKHGRFNVNDLLYKRKTVAAETLKMGNEVKEKLKQYLKESVEDGSVSVCLDMYTDDYRKKAYLDVHATWIDRQFKMKHAALAVRHFGPISHTADNISEAVNSVFFEYALLPNDTPITTDHGSNVVAALRANVRLDCMCHRLHTVLETAWKETMVEEAEATQYETAISALCRFVKQSTGLQVKTAQHFLNNFHAYNLLLNNYI